MGISRGAFGSRRIRRVVAAVGVVVTACAVATADSVREPPAVADAGRAATETSRPGREAEAMTFAAEHHPELVPLLEQLRDSAPREFAAAIGELDKTLERLDKLRERQPERYAAALAEWRVSSRIRLVLARLATSPSPEAEQELRVLVRQRRELRLSPLRSEQTRLTERLDKISAEIAAYDIDPVAAVATECEALKARFVRPAAGGRSAPQPAPADRSSGPVSGP